MSSSKRRARLSLSKKIERDLELVAKEERKKIRAEALDRTNQKEAPIES